jgi:hypothetical protein
MFDGKDFIKESEASGADVYIKGKLIVELKTKYDDWCAGFFQACHYQKKGLTFSAICVISYHFIGLWKLKDLPKSIHDIISKADSQISPSENGRINANKLNKTQKNELLKTAIFSLGESNYGMFNDSYLLEFVDYLKNIDSTRLQINPQNFIDKIELLKSFFDNPMDAIHCFYAIVNYWDITAIVAEPRDTKPDQIWISCQNGRKNSELIIVNPKKQYEFRKFIESYYVFTNQEEGLSTDYYFSRFDEVISKVDPEYTKQHGIFFTDINLSKFALWFVHHYYEKKLSAKYIILDPAAGSGNLVTSWRKNHLKHKIVSELQPDLLKIIERRMKNDEIHLQAGFTVLPKTAENKGLNFLDKTAKEYMDELQNALDEKNLKIDKPLAFLLNPPYKNTDENEDVRISKKAEYEISESILQITGEDAGRERYLAFITQILKISELQVKSNPDFRPIIMIFTPTSWLIPRPTFKQFREVFDTYFKFEKGFMINGEEFFKGTGRWPVAFSIWSYNKANNNNKIKLLDLTKSSKVDFSKINWNNNLEALDKQINSLTRGTKYIVYDNSRGNISDTLPKIYNKYSKEEQRQPRLNLYRNLQELEKGKDIVSGFALKDKRQKEIKTPYGYVDGTFVGFTDDLNLIRTYQDTCNRLTTIPDRVWVHLDDKIMRGNSLKILSGPLSSRAFCAYDLNSAKSIISWFTIAKAINGRYPIWANMFDLWSPKITKLPMEKLFYSLCFSYALSDNRCVVTKFEKDNPVKGAKEVFVDNPLSTNNDESFWMNCLDKEITKSSDKAFELVRAIKDLYSYWNSNYCKGQILYNQGLQNEPYFQYFSYPDFLTKDSGLIQIKKYAEINGKNDLAEKFAKITELTKLVKEAVYSLLVDELNYFE